MQCKGNQLIEYSRDSSELRRALQMRPVVDMVDFLLDLHSMHERSAPLSICGPLEKGIALARKLGTPSWIISDEGHPEGRRMRDYADFENADSPKNALLIECGQRRSRYREGCHCALSCIARPHRGNHLPSEWHQQPPARSRVVRITEAVVASSMDSRFAANYTGLETFSDAGSVIGWRDGEPVKTPYPNCVLVMPSLRQLRPGLRWCVSGNC